MQFSVGFGIAYPQLVGMREPDVWDEQWFRLPRFFFYMFSVLFNLIGFAFWEPAL